MPINTVADDGTNHAFTFRATPTRATVSLLEEIDVSGGGRFAVAVAEPGQVGITVNEAPGTHATAEFHMTSLNELTVHGDASTSLTVNVTSNLAATQTIIEPELLGTAQIIVGRDGTLDLKNSVAAGISIGLNGEAGNVAGLRLDDPSQFNGAINFSDGVILLPSITNAADYSYSNGLFSIYGGTGDQVLDTLRLTDTSPEAVGPELIVNSAGQIEVVEKGQENGQGNPLPQHVTPAPVPVVPQNVAVHDNTTGADVADTSAPYTGPVSGITSQFIGITPDNLNISAMADNLFIKTGTGNDAVALHGGTNVVDAGGGSNFLTSGDGFDTFFLDARNIPAAASAAGPIPGAIWDTIQNFGHGDAATFWGVGPGTALNWQPNEGAVGHTGLTLHANLANGSEASLTLAGIDSKAGLQFSYGSVAGSSYLYVKAA